MPKVHYHKLGFDPTQDEYNHPQPLMSCLQISIIAAGIMALGIGAGVVLAVMASQPVQTTPEAVSTIYSVIESISTENATVRPTERFTSTPTSTPTMTFTPTPTRTPVPVVVTREVEVTRVVELPVVVTRELEVTRIVQVTAIPRVERVVITAPPQQFVITLPPPPPQVFVTEQTIQIISTQWVVVTATPTATMTPTQEPTYVLPTVEIPESTEQIPPAATATNDGPLQSG